MHDIDTICFHQLSRRIDSDNFDYKVCYNLRQLLLTDSSISRFLKGYGIEFFDELGTIGMKYNGDIMNLNTEKYLKIRFGKGAGGFLDYCVNGYAFADRIRQNSSYYWQLKDGPEFIPHLAAFLKRPDIVSEYKANSTYYLYTYLLPLDKVVIDNGENDTLAQKIDKLYLGCFSRLYDYFNRTPSRYLFDHDNILLRIDEYSSISQDAFLSRVET
jgi:hypothetical protein